MSASVHSGGATHAIQAISVRDSDNVLRSVAVGRARNAAGALKLFFGSLAVSLDTDTVFGKVNSGLDVAIQTQPVTASPAGGAEPYSYEWTLVSSGGGTWAIGSPNAATTAFSGGNCGPGEGLTATFHCTVTDSAGNVVTSDTVEASVNNIGFNVSGGGGPLP